MPELATAGKPKLHFSQILNMCFGFLGIQFGWGLQMANMSAIFEHLGATNIAGLWLAAPLTGLIVQPIIGYLSDHTWHPTFGRRRPYFFIGAVLSSIALLLMPNSSSLWMAAGLLWVLDASINISMEPFRAFVADKLPEEQRTLGFTTQSFFIGVGAVLASVMPFVLTNWFSVENESEGGIPTSVKLSFYIGAAAFFTCVLYTILTTKEYPPASIPDKEKAKESRKGFGGGVKEITHSIAHLPRIMRQLAPVQFFTWMGLFCMWIFFGVTITRSAFGYKDTNAKEDMLFEAMQKTANIRLAEAMGNDEKKIKPVKKEINKFFNSTRAALPEEVGADLATIQTDIVTKFNDPKYQADYKGIADKIKANNADAKNEKTDIGAVISSGLNGRPAPVFVDEYRSNKKKYNDGVEWGGNCFAMYSLVTFLFAFMLPVLANRIGKKRTHFICLTLGGIGLLAVMFIANKYMLLASMVGIGILWASTLSMPYAMLSNKLPENKIGIYMGIFNFFIVIPEIISALSFDWLLEHAYNWNRAAFVGTGGILMILAAFLCLRVTESD